MASETPTDAPTVSIAPTDVPTVSIAPTVAPTVSNPPTEAPSVDVATLTGALVDYTKPGSYLWEVPQGITAVVVKLFGGGGGGKIRYDTIRFK